MSAGEVLGGVNEEDEEEAGKEETGTREAEALEAFAAEFPAAPEALAATEPGGAAPEAVGAKLARGEGEEEAGAEGAGHRATSAESSSTEQSKELGETAKQVRRRITRERIACVLKDNMATSERLAESNRELRDLEADCSELHVQWMASTNITERQRLVAQALTKSTQSAVRADLQKISDGTRACRELEDVLCRLKVVHRQLAFATESQARQLEECQNKFQARGRRIRKLELALYQVVAQAQCDEQLGGVVAGLVQKAGTLVQNVLSREAKRQALELMEGEHTAADAAHPQPEALESRVASSATPPH